VFWGPWLSLAPSYDLLRRGHIPGDGQHVIANLVGVMPALMTATAVLGVVGAVLLFPPPLEYGLVAAPAGPRACLES
jgi:hypothetical protein